MKKYACLLIFSLLLNGCDDGDLTVDSIDFGTVNPATCSTTDNTLLYKLKSQEAFLLQMPKDGGIKNLPGTYEYDIDGTNYRVVYRSYNGTLDVNNICALIPPSTPAVTEEWIANSGKIEIVTTPKVSPVATDGSTKIEGYTHNINFLNIIFAVPNSVPQTYPTFAFGTLSTTISIPATLAFSTPEIAYRCTTNKQVYNFSPAFYIMIDNIDPDLLKEEVTPAGNPRRGYISTTTNKVYYRSVAPASNTGSITKAYFCNATFPASPSISEEWIGANGVPADQSGVIEVTTSLSGSAFVHTVVLKNVTMTKGTAQFKLPTDFLLGRIE